MSIDPSTTAARVTAGVDWAKDDHAVAWPAIRVRCWTGTPSRTTRPG